jgi:hypothetical protein
MQEEGCCRGFNTSTRSAGTAASCRSGPRAVQSSGSRTSGGLRRRRPEPSLGVIRR